MIAFSEKKKTYQGPKLAGDSTAYRAKAKTNAQGLTTNAVFAAESAEFKAACEKAGVPPTKRQASKYRRKRGLAYEVHR